MENASQNRTVGYYVSLIVTILSSLLTVIYISTYSGTVYISWVACISMAAVVLFNVVLMAMKKVHISPYITALLILIAYMFYFYRMYFYISVVMVGIDLSSFDSKFIINTAVFSVVFVLSIINIFLRQRKEIDSITTGQKVLITVPAILLALLCLSSVIVKENSGAISAFLGTKTFKIIEADDSNVDTAYFKSKYNNLSELLSAGIKVSKQAEAEGVVLLKNDNNALPMNAASRNVSLFGITSVDPVYGGTGSGAVNTATAPTIKEAMETGGFKVNDSLWNLYMESKANYGRKELRSARSTVSSGISINEVPWQLVLDKAGDSFVQYGDAAIFIIGRVGGEGSDLAMTGYRDPTSTDGNYLKLSTVEIKTLEGLAGLKGVAFDKLIVLINSANQIETDFLNDSAYKIDAALWIGGVGQVGLYAVADILAGTSVPSGRLSDTFWNDHDLNPVHSNFGAYVYKNAKEFGLATGYNQYVVYQEGIYLGYRYTETRYEDVVMQRANAGDFDYAQVVTYPFGYGLSYTDFSYTNYSVVKNKDGRTYTASVDVTNTGSTYSGKEVVQFYVQKPYTAYDIKNGIEKASVDLVQFAKTGILAPGKTEKITVKIDEKYFASYDASGAKTYILDDGEYFVAVGKNAHDALNNILAAKDYSTENGMDYNGNAALVASFKLDFNSEKYSVSDATDATITNLFDFADPNRYEEAGTNEVKYLSRNNWEETVVLGKNTSIVMNQNMADALMAQTAPLQKDDIGYPAYGVNSGINTIAMRVDEDGERIPFDDPSWDAFMDQLTWEETTQLLSTGLRKTSAIGSIAKPETLDHNGPSGLTQPYSSGPIGLATTTNDPDKDASPMCYPSNGIIASTFNQELAYSIGEMVGEDALWAGYSGLYGTGANMHRSPYEGRAFEYYSEDPILSGMMVSKESEGIQSKGCYVYLKHFALNEQENGRVGIATWSNEQALREIYLRAFEIPIVKGGAKNVMQAFNRIGLFAAPNASLLMQEFLREELGMEGFTVTDFYGAYGSTLARANTVLTGTDLPDGDIDPSKTFDAYKTGYGELAHAMRLSAKRIIHTVVHSNAMNGISSSTTVVKLTPGYIIALNVSMVVVSIFLITGLVLIVMSRRKKTSGL